MLGISTHTLTWSVTGRVCASELKAANFNSHAHVERDVAQGGTLQKCFDFNSHAHVERDSYIIDYCTSIEISTHTLTWSVTGKLIS